MVTTHVALGGETVAFRHPPDLSNLAIIAPGDPFLAEAVGRRRPKRLLEVASGFGLVGLAALENGWSDRVVWVMRDLIGALPLRETLEAERLSGGEVILGEGPLDASDESFDVVILHQQRSRALTETLIRQALVRVETEGLVLVAGAVKEGVSGSEAILREVCEVVEVAAWGRGVRIMTARKPQPGRALHETAPRRRHRAEIAGTTVDWITTDGVFSADGLDPATELLLETVTLPHRGRILDFGCGAGVIGLWCAARMPDVTVTMVDSDVASVRCAEEGARLNALGNARALLSDGALLASEERFDVVITNPPVHRGRKCDPTLVEGFARAAARAIGRKGRLWLVTAPTVPIRRALEELFTDVRIAAENGSFRVWDAIRRPSQRRERQVGF